MVSTSIHLRGSPSGRLRHVPLRLRLITSPGFTPEAESLAEASGAGRKVGTEAVNMPENGAVSVRDTPRSASPELVEIDTLISSCPSVMLRSLSRTAT